MSPPQGRGVQAKFVITGIFIIIMGVALFPAILAFMSMSGWFEVPHEFTVPAGMHYWIT